MDFTIIFCAKYLIFIIALLALGYWFTLSRKLKVEIIIFGVITLVVAYLLAKVGGNFFYDTRPFASEHTTPLFAYTADNGFPSDHTLLSATIAATLFLASKKWGIGLLILSLIVGISRVLAHVHHPIDILGSLMFVAIASAVAYWTAPKIMLSLSRSSYASRLGLGHPSN